MARLPLFILSDFMFIGFLIFTILYAFINLNSFEKPNDQSTFDALAEAFKNKSYILLTAGFFVCGFHVTFIALHLPADLIDRGLEGWTAATILSLIGLFNIFGSLLSGYLSTKMSKKIILSLIYLQHLKFYKVFTT